MKTTYMRPSIHITSLSVENTLLAASNDAKNSLFDQTQKTGKDAPNTGGSTSDASKVETAKGYAFEDWSDCWGE